MKAVVLTTSPLSGSQNSRLARNQVALASMKEMIAALHGPGPFSGGILGADPQVVNAVGLVCVVLR